MALPRRSEFEIADGNVAAPGGVTAAPALLAVVERLLRELHAADAPGLPTVTLASVLDRDLGFDSLARTELLLRTEREFGIRLPDDTLQRTETVGDLLLAAEHAAAAPAQPTLLRPPPATPARPRRPSQQTDASAFGSAFGSSPPPPRRVFARPASGRHWRPDRQRTG